MWPVDVACYIGIFQHYFIRLLGVNLVLRYRVYKHSFMKELFAKISAVFSNFANLGIYKGSVFNTYSIDNVSWFSIIVINKRKFP